jgi:carbonic anhydrase/acetyltransferase-like protein (isoleucine patch superfamily)
LYLNIYSSLRITIVAGEHGTQVHPSEIHGCVVCHGIFCGHDSLIVLKWKSILITKGNIQIDEQNLMYYLPNLN